MTKRFIVGLDGSPGANAALAWATGFAAHVDAAVLAIHALDEPFVDVLPATSNELVAEREAHVAAWVRPVEGNDVPVFTELYAGDPRSALTAAIDAEHPDLLVLGRTGTHRDPGSTHLGGVIDHTAHHLRCPLAAIPIATSHRFSRIVLGVDGSRESMAAIAWCAEYAQRLDAKIVAVEVREPELEWVPSNTDARMRSEVEHEIDKWTTPLRRVGVDVEHAAIIHQHPAEGLIRVARAHRADLLVIGSRGAGGFLGLHLGGVAMKVLHHATIPLVIVPPAAAVDVNAR